MYCILKTIISITDLQSQSQLCFNGFIELSDPGVQVGVLPQAEIVDCLLDLVQSLLQDVRRVGAAFEGPGDRFIEMVLKITIIRHYIACVNLT
jgi:hypothetical protein